MCLLLSNAVADEGFNELQRMGQRGYEQKLARLANEDDINRANGLGLLLNRVSCWQGNENLRNVFKYRMGRHRFYITGNHTECTYRVIYVMVNKRDEEDKPHDGRFQNMILKALADDRPARPIEPPQAEGEEAQPQ